MATEQEQVFILTKEIINNNKAIGNHKAEIKKQKDLIKAFEERNEAIMDELKVRCEDDDLDIDE